MHITFYRSVHSPVLPEHQIDTTWEDIKTNLLEFNDAKNKEDSTLFNLWELKRQPEAEVGGYVPKDPITGEKDHEKWVELPGTIRRCKANAIGLHGMVLDWDSNKSIKEVEELFKDYEYVIYTTFNHSPEKDKFRVVMPFDRMMTKEEFYKKLPSIEAKFPGVDKASFSVSQAIYFHSGKNKEYAYSNYNKGKFLTVDEFDDVIQEEIIVNSTPWTEFSDDQYKLYKEAVLRSLATCSDVRRGGGDALTLALICKSVKANYQEYTQLCVITSPSDSCMRNSGVQKAVWDSVNGDHISKQKRDRFIKKYNGQPIKVASVKISKLKELATKLKEK